MPTLGVFCETDTVTFANEEVRELMRKMTRQTSTTGAPLTPLTPYACVEPIADSRRTVARVSRYI